MVASNIRDLIRKLVAIQKIDEDLFAFRREIRDKPEEMAQLEGSFEKKKQVYHALELRLREIELSRKAKELDLKSKELEIIKADASLMMLKTNKEYQIEADRNGPIHCWRKQVPNLIFIKSARHKSQPHHINCKKHGH